MQAEENQQETRLREEFAGLRVLVVDDESINGEIACLMLEDAGLHAEAAVNGKQALDMLADGRFSLVLMDMMMPEMNGLVASRRVRERFDQKALPIIAMTANSQPDVRDECLSAGMNDYLAKPFVPEAFYEKVLSTLRDSRDSTPNPRQSKQSDLTEHISTSDAGKPFHQLPIREKAMSAEKLKSLGKVLIVDDDPGQLAVLACFMDALDLHAITASSGDQAVAMACQHKVDMVLMDLHLPGIDGVEAAQSIRSLRPGVPVIMVSADQSQSTRAVGLEVGISDFVHKPLDFEKIVERMLAVIESA